MNGTIATQPPLRIRIEQFFSQTDGTCFEEWRFNQMRDGIQYIRCEDRADIKPATPAEALKNIKKELRKRDESLYIIGCTPAVWEFNDEFQITSTEGGPVIEVTQQAGKLVQVIDDFILFTSVDIIPHVPAEAVDAYNRGRFPKRRNFDSVKLFPSTGRLLMS